MNESESENAVNEYPVELDNLSLYAPSDDFENEETFHQPHGKT